MDHSKIILPIFLLLLGCSHVSHPPGSTSLKVTHSQEDTELTYAAVLPVLRGDGQYCSGSLVMNSNLVLTARHCLLPGRSDGGVTVLGQAPRYVLGDDKYEFGNYTVENAARDYVFLVFNMEPVFQAPGLTNAKLLNISFPHQFIHMADVAPGVDTFSIDKPVTLVGYGLRKRVVLKSDRPIISGHGVGVEGDVSNMQPRSFCTRDSGTYRLKYRGTTEADLEVTPVFEMTDRNENSPCLPMPGDSGGPVVWRNDKTNKLELLAIASTVFSPETGEMKAVYVPTFGTKILEKIQIAFQLTLDLIKETEERSR